MFFLLIATNLTVYLSSLQLFANNRLLAGGSTLMGGIILTFFSNLAYKAKKLKSKKKKRKDICDCDNIPDCDC